MVGRGQVDDDDGKCKRVNQINQTQPQSQTRRRQGYALGDGERVVAVPAGGVHDDGARPEDLAPDGVRQRQVRRRAVHPRQLLPALRHDQLQLLRVGRWVGR